MPTIPFELFGQDEIRKGEGERGKKETAGQETNGKQPGEGHDITTLNTSKKRLTDSATVIYPASSGVMTASQRGGVGLRRQPYNQKRQAFQEFTPDSTTETEQKLCF